MVLEDERTYEVEEDLSSKHLHFSQQRHRIKYDLFTGIFYPQLYSLLYVKKFQILIHRAPSVLWYKMITAPD